MAPSGTCDSMRAITACAVAMLIVLSLAPLSGAQVPETVSTPVLRALPESALYLDPVFDFEMTRQDVVYGSNVDSEGDVQDLLLDVWEPIGHDATDRPVVMWMSGGGFTNVDKSGLLPRTEGFLRRGYVVVSIEYRVRPGGGGSFTGVVEAVAENGADGLDEVTAAALDAQEDAKAAIRWIRANAADLRIDPERLVVAGWSAGAAISLALAFSPDPPGNSGNPGWPNHVTAALSGAGGYLPFVQGEPIQPGAPPVQIHHGTHDTVVPAGFSLAPCAITLALGNVCEAHLYPGGDHGLADRLEHWETETISFLYRHVVDPEPLFPVPAGL